MSILDKNFGHREITVDGLVGLGFQYMKHAVTNINGVNCTTYQFFIKLSSFIMAYHEFTYLPELNELRVKVNVDAWRCRREYKINPSCLEDIIIEINRYRN